MRVGLLLLAAFMAYLTVGPAATYAASQRPYVLEMSCEPDATAVSFIIPSSADVGARLAAGGVTAMPDAIWIDLSLFDNGFVGGTFLNAGPFLPGATNGYRFNWFHVARGKMHYYRLNAHVGTRWVELGRGSFESIDCTGVDAIACPPGKATASVRFLLPPLSATRPVERWIDLSLFDNGFLPHTYLGVPMEQRESLQEFVWEGIREDTRHYYRMNWLFPDGVWIVQRTGSFRSLACIGLPSVPPLTID